jgi:hypothetical protein
MREIRTSGSTRGGWVVLMSDIAHSPTLPLRILVAKTQRTAKIAKVNPGVNPWAGEKPQFSHTLSETAHFRLSPPGA